jgi:formate/nitrite transporter FocA (FNT family)
VRLWLVTLAANLVGGLVMAGLIAVALPDLRSVAAMLGHHYATLGVSWRSLLLAVLAGIVITLLTRMQHASDDLGPKLVAGVAMSFVLVAAQLGWSGLGNLVGGIGLVTSLRLLQAPHRVAEERADQS